MKPRGSGVARAPHQPLVVVAIAVFAGIVFDRCVARSLFGNDLASWNGAWFIACWLVAACLVGVWCIVWRSRRDGVAALVLLAATAAVGAAWHDARWFLYPDVEIGRYASDLTASPACIDGILLGAPEQLAPPEPTPLRAIPAIERSRLVIEVLAIRDGRQWRAAGGTCEVHADGHVLGVRAGDRVRVFGQLARMAGPLNPGEFDFAAHDRAERILTRVRSTAPESVAVTRRASRWSLWRAVDAVRFECQRVLRRYVGPERSGLAAAILFGARGGLPSSETEAYLATGTIHVLVVSGMNVGILALGLYGLIRVGWLSRRAGLTAIIVAVVIYTLLARAEPPVLRAAVLAVLVGVAAWVGRRGMAFNSLAMAAIIVLLINPAELFRAGTQLSFLCVAALIWVGEASWSRTLATGDRLEELLAAARPWYVRWSLSAWWRMFWLLVATLAVFFASLPLVLHHFHILSPVSVPISPLVWVFVTLAMWSGFLLLIFGWLWWPIAESLGAVCNGSLAGLERTVEWAGALRGGHFWVPGPAAWWVIGFYALLLGLMIWGRSILSLRWQAAAICGWILIGLAPVLWRSPDDDNLRVSFVSVGHGTCVLLEGPGGERLLYDAGSLGSPEYAIQSIASYLWHRGITGLDGIVLSHADVDHYNAVPGLVERFDVGAVFVSPVMFSRFGPAAASEAPQVLREALVRADVPLREIWSGDRLRVGSEIVVEVLHPPRRGVLGNDNANSVMLAVECRGRRILLPGDLESPGLEAVMAELPYDCDVLLAPHHGSGRSDPPGFAAWSTPEWVVISGSGSNDIEPVVRAYERGGATVLDTHRWGAIEFLLGAETFDVATCRRR